MCIDRNRGVHKIKVCLAVKNESGRTTDVTILDVTNSTYACQQFGLEKD